MKKLDSQTNTGIIVILFFIFLFIYPRPAISLLILYVAVKISYVTYIALKYKKSANKIITYGLGEDITLSKKQSIVIAFSNILIILILCVLVFLILFDISAKQIFNAIR